MLIKLSVAGASGAFICLAVHLIGTLKKGWLRWMKPTRRLQKSEMP